MFVDNLLFLFVACLCFYGAYWFREEVRKRFRSRKEPSRQMKITQRRQEKEADRPVTQYSISTDDFAKIAYKATYRFSKTEEAVVRDNEVRIKINSQSGLSYTNVKLVFQLSGMEDNVGSYTLWDDNLNSNFSASEHIADKIKKEIRRKVGLVE